MGRGRGVWQAKSPGTGHHKAAAELPLRRARVIIQGQRSPFCIRTGRRARRLGHRVRLDARDVRGRRGHGGAGRRREPGGVHGRRATCSPRRRRRRRVASSVRSEPDDDERGAVEGDDRGASGAAEGEAAACGAVAHPCPTSTSTRSTRARACGVLQLSAQAQRKTPVHDDAQARLRCPSSTVSAPRCPPAAHRSRRARITPTAAQPPTAPQPTATMADDDTLNTTTTTGGGIIFDTYTDWWVFLTITVVCWSVCYGVVSKSKADASRRRAGSLVWTRRNSCCGCSRSSSSSRC